MKEKSLIIAGITAAVLIICFVVYNTYSNTEVESEQIAVVFPMDEMVSTEMFEEAINDLYIETLVESESTEEESNIQEIAEAVEIENEEILITDESTENVSGGEDLTATQPTPAPEGGDNGGGVNGLTPEQQAFLDSLGGGGYIPETPSAGEGHNGTGNHGIVMAQ